MLLHNAGSFFFCGCAAGIPHISTINHDALEQTVTALVNVHTVALDLYSVMMSFQHEQINYFLQTEKSSLMSDKFESSG